MTTKIESPCPCGGKVRWKKERVVMQGIDCGMLDIEVCDRCGEEYLPDKSMALVEGKLKAAGLWGTQRKEIKFWKSGSSVTTRFPAEVVKKTGLDKAKKGFIYSEGEGKITIEF